VDFDPEEEARQAAEKASYHDALQLHWARNRARRDGGLGEDWLIFLGDPSGFDNPSVAMLVRLECRKLIEPQPAKAPETTVWWGEGSVVRRLTDYGRVVLLQLALGDD
jgi:hypothetical protein